MSLGKFGAFAQFQSALFTRAALCSGADADKYGIADGIYGPATRRAIVDLQRCYPFGPALADGPATDGGAVTSGLWELLLPQVPLPTVRERAAALTLVLEATDYDDLQYNFCQSRNPATRKTFLDGDPECFSNDRASFITWGPRGATAGHGAEVQQILSLIDQADPEILNTAFGPEASTMRRLNVASGESIPLILCSIWIDPARRELIRGAFKNLGQNPRVQQLYLQAYDTRDADGAKIEKFYQIYANLRPLIHRAPSEMDFAFFLDRATHGGAPTGNVDKVAQDLRLFISTVGDVSPAALRNRLAELLPVTNQVADRRARDLIFLLDDPKLRFSDTDLIEWKKRAGFRASDFGLSDDRSFGDYQAASSAGFADRARLNNATSAERRQCPAIVLTPKKP